MPKYEPCKDPRSTASPGSADQDATVIPAIGLTAGVAAMLASGLSPEHPLNAPVEPETPSPRSFAEVAAEAAKQMPAPTDVMRKKGAAINAIEQCALRKADLDRVHSQRDASAETVFDAAQAFRNAQREATTAVDAWMEAIVKEVNV